MTAYLLFFFVCLLLSAFFSGAEMAFVSANKVKLREAADSGDRRAGEILRLEERPQRFLTAVLIGNNVVNISAAAIFTCLLEMRFGLKSEWLVAAILLPVLLVFGEMVPKDYGRLRSQKFLLDFSDGLSLLSKILGAPSAWILRAIDFFMGEAGERPRKSIFVDEEEFRSLIEESAKLGVLARHEKKLIDTILDFERIHVDSVMIPVEKVAKVELTKTVKGAKDIARRTNAPMLLVYEEIPSIIMGMIYVFDLLFDENEEQGLKKFLRSPVFLVRNTSIERAFLTLQHRRQSFAVVTDFNGEVVGVVPIERLLAV